MRTQTPGGDTALPVPDRFTENGEPPVVTLTGLRPPGGIEVTGGTVRIRFVEHAGTVTTEAAEAPRGLADLGGRFIAFGRVGVIWRPLRRLTLTAQLDAHSSP